MIKNRKSSHTIRAKRKRDEKRKLKALIAELVTTLKHTHEKMESDQIEIDRLKSETRAIISKLLAP
jgi:hypothetical protein